jgi:hypothetical protein
MGMPSVSLRSRQPREFAMSALPPIADIDWPSSNVGFVPKADIETNLRLEKKSRAINSTLDVEMVLTTIVAKAAQLR